MSMMYLFILKGCLIRHGHFIVTFLEIGDSAAPTSLIIRRELSVVFGDTLVINLNAVKTSKNIIQILLFKTLRCLPSTTLGCLTPAKSGLSSEQS